MTVPLPAEWTEWLETGARLLAAPPLRRSQKSAESRRDPKFLLGDYLLGIPEEYIDLLAEALGTDRLSEYREVAARFPPHSRVAACWTVHRDLLDHPELLRDGLKVRDVPALVGKKPIDSPRDDRLPLKERAKRAREALADPDVYALIDREMAEGRAERQLRRRAQQVRTEHDRRARELEEELRQLRAAKSPAEATVKAELDINKATQYVEAVGATLQDLPLAERLLAALGELNAATAAVLLAHEPSPGPENGPIVIEGEVVADPI